MEESRERFEGQTSPKLISFVIFTIYFYDNKAFYSLSFTLKLLGNISAGNLKRAVPSWKYFSSRQLNVVIWLAELGSLLLVKENKRLYLPAWIVSRIKRCFGSSCLLLLYHSIFQVLRRIMVIFRAIAYKYWNYKQSFLNKFLLRASLIITSVTNNSVLGVTTKYSHEPLNFVTWTMTFQPKRNHERSDLMNVTDPKPLTSEKASLFNLRIATISIQI